MIKYTPYRSFASKPPYTMPTESPALNLFLKGLCWMGLRRDFQLQGPPEIHVTEKSNWLLI